MQSRVYQRQIHGSSTSDAAVFLNTRFLTRLLTSGEEDFERVSMLKEDISSKPYSLWTDNVDFVHVTFSMTCLTT